MTAAPATTHTQEDTMTSTSTRFTGSIGTVAQHGLPQEVDVAVLGSGGAGLLAALTAA